MSLLNILSRFRMSRGVSLLVGLTGCGVLLLLSARLVIQCSAQVAARGAGQLAVMWPGLVVMAVPAAMVGTLSFAALVYGTGGLTSWHETGSEAENEPPSWPVSAVIPEARAEEDVAGAEEDVVSAAESAEEKAAGAGSWSAASDGHWDSSPGSSEGFPPKSESIGELYGSRVALALEAEPGRLAPGSTCCRSCGTVNSEMVPFCAGCGEDL